MHAESDGHPEIPPGKVSGRPIRHVRGGGMSGRNPRPKKRTPEEEEEEEEETSGVGAGVRIPRNKCPIQMKMKNL